MKMENVLYFGGDVFEMPKRNVEEFANPSNPRNLKQIWNRILYTPEDCAFSGGKERCILLLAKSRYELCSPRCMRMCKYFEFKQEGKKNTQ